jgi:hypothetical protein
MSKGFPGKLRNRELTGKLLQYALDLSTNPKLWDLILPRDLKEWYTEGELIFNLWEECFQHRLTMDEPECKETLLKCVTLAELLTASQDICEVHIRDFESWYSLSYYKSLYRLGHSILQTLWVHTYKCTLYTLDDLHLEYTFNNLYNPENNNYMLDIFVSSDVGNDCTMHKDEGRKDVIDVLKKL